MKSVHRLSRIGLPGLVVAAICAVASAGLGGSVSHGRHLPGGMPAPAATVEPLPGLALDLNVTAVEETARGGVVSLTLKTTSAVQIATLSLAMHLPPHVLVSGRAPG